MNKIATLVKHRESRDFRFLLAIAELFRDGNVVDYQEYIANQTVEFGLKNVDVTFEQLAAMSDLLGTRKINISDSFIEDKGCETCGHGRITSTPISCSRVVFANRPVLLVDNSVSTC